MSNNMFGGLFGLGQQATSPAQPINISHAELKAWHIAIQQQYQQAVSNSSVPSWTEPTKPIKSTPLPKADVAGPIVAYRAWTVKRGTGILNAVGAGDFNWMYGVPSKAHCISSSHDAPMAGCKCGWYGVKNLDLVKQEFQDINIIVFGKVALWGKVIAHEHGYRAEYAYPVELYWPTAPMPGFPISKTLTDERQRIEDNYGCAMIDA